VLASDSYALALSALSAEIDVSCVAESLRGEIAGCISV